MWNRCFDWLKISVFVWNRCFDWLKNLQSVWELFKLQHTYMSLFVIWLRVHCHQTTLHLLIFIIYFIYYLYWYVYKLRLKAEVLKVILIVRFNIWLKIKKFVHTIRKKQHIMGLACIQIQETRARYPFTSTVHPTNFVSLVRISSWK